MLFLIYINDLSLNTTLSSILFADDTCLFHSDSDPDRLNLTLNAELEKISNWLTSNKLTLNVAKSNFILFYGKHNKIKDFNLFISGGKLKNTSNCKYLGIIMDEHLNWKEQIKLVSNKIKQGVGMLHKIGRYISKRSLISLYYALIQSHLTYCVSAWGNPETPGINKINKFIHKCFKLINNKANDTPEANTKFNPLNIRSLYRLEACKLVHRYLNNKPKSSINLFVDHPRKFDIKNPARRNEKNSVSVIHFDQAECPLMYHAPLAWQELECHKIVKLSSHSLCSHLKNRLYALQ